MNGIKVERLGVEHYDQIINLLNEVFTRHNGSVMDMEKALPKMAQRTQEAMCKHFGIFDNERLVACLGVYPFMTKIAGEELLFSTTGNVVVHWDYEGRGYMGAMLDRAMQENADLGVAVSRLGGLRSRYNRYGFEECGQVYRFNFTEKNRLRKLSDFLDEIKIEEIDKDNLDALEFTIKLNNGNGICVPRTIENAYATCTAWQNIPYLATKNNKPMGYFCAQKSGGNIAEIFALDCVSLAEIVCAIQKQRGCTVTFNLQPHQVDEVRLFSSVCESLSTYSPSRFCVLNWEKTIGALMRLKAKKTTMQKGELRIRIEEYGTVKLSVTDSEITCEKSDEKPDIILDRLSATRYIFGPLSPLFTADASPLAQSWFPLPLSWNGQDRV